MGDSKAMTSCAGSSSLMALVARPSDGKAADRIDELPVRGRKTSELYTVISASIAG